MKLLSPSNFIIEFVCKSHFGILSSVATLQKFFYCTGDENSDRSLHYFHEICSQSTYSLFSCRRINRLDTTNVIIDPLFTSSSSWNTYTTTGSAFYFSTPGLLITLSSTGANPWDTTVSQSQTFSNGVFYRVFLTANSTATRVIGMKKIQR